MVVDGRSVVVAGRAAVMEAAHLGRRLVMRLVVMVVRMHLAGRGRVGVHGVGVGGRHSAESGRSGGRHCCGRRRLVQGSLAHAGHDVLKVAQMAAASRADGSGGSARRRRHASAGALLLFRLGRQFSVARLDPFLFHRQGSVHLKKKKKKKTKK